MKAASDPTEFFLKELKKLDKAIVKEIVGDLKDRVNL